MSRSALSGLVYQCPHCRGPVRVVVDAMLCVSGECRRQYPIVDGIPKFLLDDGQALSAELWQQRMNGHSVDLP